MRKESTLRSISTVVWSYSRIMSPGSFRCFAAFSTCITIRGRGVLWSTHGTQRHVYLAQVGNVRGCSKHWRTEAVAQGLQYYKRAQRDGVRGCNSGPPAGAATAIERNCSRPLHAIPAAHEAYLVHPFLVLEEVVHVVAFNQHANGGAVGVAQHLVQ